MSDPSELSAEAVEAAVARLQSVVRTTPLEQSGRLSNDIGMPVFLKREDVQICRSYKVRGAYNFVSSLSSGDRAAGVTCASAGNHGQGLAFACHDLKIRGRVFVPGNTPRQKRERIVALGGPFVELIVAGDTYDEASVAAYEDSARTGSIYVHPFDDSRTIAGQGTVAVEIAAQLPGSIGTVVVPVGGGGLIAGIALWLKERLPSVKIVGVEPEGAPSMTAALSSAEVVTLSSVDTFVDGAAVARVGSLTYPVVRDLVDEMVTVPEGAICTEILSLYQTEGIIAEPAGALASSALLHGGITDLRGAVVCIVSGGNNDVSRYAEIVERSLVYEGLRHYFLVTFPQEPGALRRFLDEMLGKDDDIILFEYMKKNNRETGPALVGIELSNVAGLEPLLERMDESPLQIERVPPGSPLFTFLF